MGRKPRIDYEGAWHHVFHRGLAKRTVFEVDEDYRFFKALLAKEARRDELEIHAYVLMQNHFHLLVRSAGGLDRAMQRVLSSYVRNFNRRRERDGPLFRGRYASKLVESDSYRGILVSYIDANPVRAGLATRPEEYPNGSAHDRLRGSANPWLESAWIEKELAGDAARLGSFAAAYRYAFHSGAEWARDLVEARMASKANGPDALDRLLSASADEVRRFFAEQKVMADGCLDGPPLASTPDVEGAVRDARDRHGAWRVFIERRDFDAWELVTVALRRELCRESNRAIARSLAASSTQIHRAHQRHLRAMADPRYARRLGEVGGQIMAIRGKKCRFRA